MRARKDHPRRRRERPPWWTRGIVALAALVVLAAVAAVVSRPGEEAQAADGDPADTVFVNGRVMLFPDGDGSPASLMAPTLGWAQAVAVKDGRIAFVGDDDGARKRVGPQTRVVDLRNKLLMPGLGDGHLHGGARPQCDLHYEGGTIDTVLGRLKECLTRPDQVQHLNSNYRLSASNLMGEGLLPRGTRLDRRVLDRLSRDPADDPYGTGTTRPIVVSHMDKHKSYTNTKAIENAGLDASTPDPTDGFIGRDEDGYPNGQFADYSANWGPSAPGGGASSYDTKVDNYRFVNSLGITSIFHPGGGSRSSLELLRRLADEGRLTVRVNQGMSGGQVRNNDDAVAIRSWIAGLDRLRSDFDGYRSPNSPGAISVDTVKVFCDGVPEFPGQTAAMLRPYMRNVGTPENPQWVPGDRRGEEPSCEDATKGFVALDADRWNIHVHSLGDRSTRVTLDNYLAAQKANATWDRRHAITHLEFVDKRDLRRFGKLGVIASMTGQWAQRDAWSVDGIEGYVEADRMDNMYPARDIIAGGGVVAQGSDWTVTDLLPWSAIEQFVTRTGEDNPARAIYPGALNGKTGIALAQAYRASTIGVAYQLHQEGVTGSIEVGKWADMIVVDDDPFFVAGVSDELAKEKAALPAAQQALTGARDAVGTAEQALAAAQRAVGPKTTALSRAVKAQRTATTKLAAARKALKKASARYRAVRRAARTAPRTHAAALKRAKRADAAARRTAQAAKRALAAARRKTTAARGAETTAKRAVAQATDALTSARGAATRAETALGDANARIERLGRAEAEGVEQGVKRISDTKVLMTMVGGVVVYTSAGNPLGA